MWKLYLKLLGFVAIVWTFRALGLILDHSTETKKMLGVISLSFTTVLATYMVSRRYRRSFVYLLPMQFLVI